MKTLKLEVGKTYRSREGEEVKITGCDGGYYQPYKGTNGEWYTEGGRWQFFSAEENPKDLIEEVTVSDASQKRNKMEQVKLEVGKTYISRKGEEVRIIKNDGKGRYSYQGSDGKWYAESGKWDYVSNESPEDLIEELPETHHTFGLVPEALTAIRYTFDIPDGMKKGTVSQEGNRIIVEMVSEEGKSPKPGDVMINKQGNVYIFKSVVDSDTHAHCSWLGKSGRLSISGTCEPGRPATPEEAKLLFDALKKAGKQWNAETMQVADIPESDRIREWVGTHLNDGYYNQQGIAEVIGHYLKYREGK